MKRGFVYIITNKYHTVFYTGVTSDLISRIIQHREKHLPNSFTAKYNCCKLVYYEYFEGIEAAIEQEKYIKGKKRSFKVQLIITKNLEFADLWTEIKDW